METIEHVLSQAFNNRATVAQNKTGGPGPPVDYHEWPQCGLIAALFLLVADKPAGNAAERAADACADAGITAGNGAYGRARAGPDGRAGKRSLLSFRHIGAAKAADKGQHRARGIDTLHFMPPAG